MAARPACFITWTPLERSNLPARPPLLRIVLQLRESHLKLHGPLTTPRSFHTMKLHPSAGEPPWTSI